MRDETFWMDAHGNRATVRFLPMTGAEEKPYVVSVNDTSGYRFPTMTGAFRFLESRGFQKR